MNDTRPASPEAQALDELLDSIAAEQEEAWQENERYFAQRAARNAERLAEEARRASRYNVTTRYSIAPIATQRGIGE